MADTPIPGKDETEYRRVMGLLGEIKKVFGPNYKLTLLAEMPHRPEEDSVISETTIDNIYRMVQRAKLRRGFSPGGIILPH